MTCTQAEQAGPHTDCTTFKLAWAGLPRWVFRQLVRFSNKCFRRLPTTPRRGPTSFAPPGGLSQLLGGLVPAGSICASLTGILWGSTLAQWFLGVNAGWDDMWLRDVLHTPCQAFCFLNSNHDNSALNFTTTALFLTALPDAAVSQMPPEHMLLFLTCDFKLCSCSLCSAVWQCSVADQKASSHGVPGDSASFLGSLLGPYRGGNITLLPPLSQQVLMDWQASPELVCGHTMPHLQTLVLATLENRIGMAMPWGMEFH